MPTKHRQTMIDAGLAPTHHGHDRRAVAQSKKLAAADKQVLDEAAKAQKESEATGKAALAEKRARRLARHDAELAAKTPGRKVR
jgi:hypothetical protein